MILPHRSRAPGLDDPWMGLRHSAAAGSGTAAAPEPPHVGIPALKLKILARELSIPAPDLSFFAIELILESSASLIGARSPAATCWISSVSRSRANYGLRWHEIKPGGRQQLLDRFGCQQQYGEPDGWPASCREEMESNSSRNAATGSLSAILLGRHDCGYSLRSSAWSNLAEGATAKNAAIAVAMIVQ